MPTMVARLENAGMFNSMQQILAFVKEGKGQEAYDLTAKVIDWLDKAKGFSDKQLKLRTEQNPEQERLARDREEFERQKEETYTKTALADVNRMNNGQMAKATAAFFKDVGLRPEEQAEFKKALTSRIWAQMAKDEPYLRAAKAIRAKGDMERHTNFVHSKFVELLPDAFRRLRNEMYPNYKPVAAKPGTKIAAGAPKTNGAGTEKKPAAAGSADSSGLVLIPAKPDGKEVDWEKTNDVLWITGKAYMKSGKYAGKFVKWQI